MKNKKIAALIAPAIVVALFGMLFALTATSGHAFMALSLFAGGVITALLTLDFTRKNLGLIK